MWPYAIIPVDKNTKILEETAASTFNYSAHENKKIIQIVSTYKTTLITTVVTTPNLT